MKKSLRQAWEMDDANEGEKLLRNLTRRIEKEAPGMADSILEGIHEILTGHPARDAPRGERRGQGRRRCQALAMRFKRAYWGR